MDTQNDQEPAAPSTEGIATTKTFGTPTSSEMARVIAFINEQVLEHLKDGHGLSIEEIKNPSPELFEKVTKECGLAKLWTEMQPVLLSLYQQLAIRESMSGQSLEPATDGAPKKRAPMVLGKMGQA